MSAVAVRRSLITPRSSLLDRLVSFWPLGEASGQRYDLIGGSTLTDNNTVTQSPSMQSGSYAAQFAKANSEYLSAADSSKFNNKGTNGFTFAAWVYFDSKTADMEVCSQWAGAGTNEHKVTYGFGADRFYFYGSADGTNDQRIQEPNYSPPLSTWIFVAGWYDPWFSTVNIQPNNLAVASAAFAGSLFESGTDFNVGRRVGGDYWDGRIANLAFWKRVLTSKERAWLYNDGKGRLWPWI